MDRVHRCGRHRRCWPRTIQRELFAHRRGRPWPHRPCWIARPHLGNRWRSRLVATTAEERLGLQQARGTMTMRWPRVGMASFAAVLLVLTLGHRWSVTASWFTSDKTCGERHATPWFVERLSIDRGGRVAARGARAAVGDSHCNFFRPRLWLGSGKTVLRM